MPEHPYEMTITLHVLEHLGLHLYSSTPAVLSEAVANAWDANAHEVSVMIDDPSTTIVITDDGDGMTRDDINRKYLTIGYQRRLSGDPEATVNRLGRHVMGRKGIGKLSLFAIADTIEISTIRTDPVTNAELERNAFRLRRSEIKEAAEAKRTYYPEPLPTDSLDITRGTKIVLTDLDRKATGLTKQALRRRLARRFSIIGAPRVKPPADVQPATDDTASDTTDQHTTADPANGAPVSGDQNGASDTRAAAERFVVKVDGTPIGIDDRDYFKSIQYLWSVGDVGNLYADQATRAQEKRTISGTVDAAKGWEVTGWIGTVDEHRSLEEGNNVVVLLAWGKLVQEDILKDVPVGGLYTKYVIGELRADFLDLDNQPDIATSDRQRLKETDPRYEQILAWFRREVLAPIGANWTDLRNTRSLDDALQYPGVKEWYAQVQSEDDRKAAKKLFGRIGTVMRDREVDRIELYRHTILAFETLRIRRALSAIEQLPDGADIVLFQKVFGGLDELEAAEYHKIAKARLEVIERFRAVAPVEQEKIVQKYLFDHLWLLHPSWERPTTNKHIEQAVQKEWGDLDANLSDDERKGRVDIRYTTAAGKHIIVELKKASVSINLFRIAEQMEKYRGALEKVLRRHFPEEADPNIEVVGIVGQIPDSPSAERQRDLLRAINGRMLTYDKLIEEALDSYRDYLEADERVNRLNEILDKLEVQAADEKHDDPAEAEVT